MCEKTRTVKVTTYPNGSKVVSFNNFTPSLKKGRNGGRKPKTDNERLMTFAEHKASLNRNLKTLFSLDYDHTKALFVTFKINPKNTTAPSEYTAVETKIKGLLTAIVYDKELVERHGKILYVRAIERKNNNLHIHSVFVFENSKPDAESFKKKLKGFWNVGDICIKPVTVKQGL